MPASVPMTMQVFQFSETLFGCLMIYHSEVLKLLQLLITGICWAIVTGTPLNVGKYFGLAYDIFLSCLSSAMVTTFILLLTRLAKHTTQKIRSSLFEIYFDGFIALNFIYMSTSLSLDTSVSLWGFGGLILQEVGVGELISKMKKWGYIIAILYGIDFGLAFRYYIQNMK